jgi:hypothetical protein
MTSFVKRGFYGLKEPPNTLQNPNKVIMCRVNFSVGWILALRNTNWVLVHKVLIFAIPYA